MEKPLRRKKLTKRTRQQEGFVLIWLITFLPLLLVSITFLFISTTQIEMKSALQQTCRVELLKVQTVASEHLRSLMAVNKLVDIVNWTQFLAAISTFLLIPFPFLAPFVEGVLLKTKSAKEAIPLLQNAILTSLRTSMINGLWRTRQKLTTLFKEYQAKTARLWVLNKPLFIGIPPWELSVEPEKPNSKLTKYRFKKNFVSIQSLSLRWSYRASLREGFISWAPWHQQFEGQCSATLEREAPWKAVLYAGKYSLKPL